MVGNPENRFSHNEAQMRYNMTKQTNKTITSSVQSESSLFDCSKGLLLQIERQAKTDFDKMCGCHQTEVMLDENGNFGYFVMLKNNNHTNLGLVNH